MKALLVLLIVGICAIALRMPRVASALGVAQEAVPAQDIPPVLQPRPMSANELLERSKTDPQAVQKYLASHTQAPERTEVDKLMNLLSRGKYE